MRHKTSLILVIAALVPVPLCSQTVVPDVTLSGEIRLRGEWDGRTAQAGDDAAALSRARLGVGARVRPWLSAFLQIQDARAWGTETATTDGAADQLDLHQGYIDLTALGATARLGRQELSLGDERLVGPLGWSNVARAFDGALVTWPVTGAGELRVFWMNVAERDALQPGGTDPQANEGGDLDGWLMGGFYAHRIGGARVELTFLHDRNAATDKSYTAHGRFFGRVGDVLYDGSAAYQFGVGRRGFLLSGKAGLAVGRGSIAGQVDLLSGDADTLDGTRRAFASLYPTGHAFHGYMDYFLAFPAQTRQAGLIDAMVRIAAPVPAPWTLRVDTHYFALAEERLGERALGLEVDVIAGRTLGTGVGVEAGAAIFAPRDLAGSLMPAFAGGTGDATYWGYLMMTVRFP
jgi:hypothetical protein